MATNDICANQDRAEKMKHKILSNTNGSLNQGRRADLVLIFKKKKMPSSKFRRLRGLQNENEEKQKSTQIPCWRTEIAVEH